MVEKVWTKKQTLTQTFRLTKKNSKADQYLNQTRYNFKGSGVSNTSALVFGGQPGTGPGTAKTELWTGSSWSEQNDRNTAVVGPASSGTVTSALGFGGEGPPALAVTEEWNGAGVSITRTFTDS